MLVPNYEFPAEAYVAVVLVFCLLAFLVYVLGAAIAYSVREELRYRRDAPRSAVHHAGAETPGVSRPRPRLP